MEILELEQMVSVGCRTGTVDSRLVRSERKM